MSQAGPEKFIKKWRKTGWIPEPDSLKILEQAGLEVVKHCVASNTDEAINFARKHGFPLAAKVISPEIMHKSEVGGVATNVSSEEELAEQFKRFKDMAGFIGMLTAEMVSGVELILGAKIDRQFGPVILLGVGGTGVELYGDVAIRMAPLEPADVAAMAAGLQGNKLLKGFRQHQAVNMIGLTRTLLNFSDLIMKCEELIESADINPLICTAEKCVVADARFILTENKN